MRFSEYLFQESKKIWDEYLEHPFVKEIGEGTLCKEKFKDYLIQDYLYLKEYSKVFCEGLIKASTMKEMKFFYKSIKCSMEDETAVHIKYLHDFGMEPIEVEKCEYNLVTTSYTSYMQAKALTGNLNEMAISTLPCTWSYYYIGTHLKEKYGDKLENNFYKPWIETYSSKEYDEFLEEWIEYTDKMGENITQDEKEKLRDIFVNCSIYEMQFWDMAYKRAE